MAVRVWMRVTGTASRPIFYAYSSATSGNSSFYVDIKPNPVYNLSGYVTNELSQPLSNVMVQTNTSLTTTTNATGYYNFTGIPNGTYIINASRTEYINNSITRTINGADITDAGVPHFWSFSSNDGYGGIATNTTTITVTDTSGTYINGTVRSGGNPVEGVKVSTNTSVNTSTDASGFYSLPVTAGAYELTAALEPVYYTNSSVTADMQTGVVVRDIELLIKPTGTITGSVTNV